MPPLPSVHVTPTEIEMVKMAAPTRRWEAYAGAWSTCQVWMDKDGMENGWTKYDEPSRYTREQLTAKKKILCQNYEGADGQGKPQLQCNTEEMGARHGDKPLPVHLPRGAHGKKQGINMHKYITTIFHQD
ncbi:hypothetical protein GPALN_011920 [Globodera pallida]|nr:hypothetical protein GPALN_011920 [Globodera pallida]